ncbi:MULTISPECIES: twin-arginine translocase TatA/TatE family subunit [Streptomyces]|uniref:Twin-arginine translocase TatA/TatE family subunit n=1 Tax=Streptomyces evansiae TaxID=3075535 RepID=A0ABU2QWW7_9ACTN|nr:MULTISPECIES: twin-arginine translocase TatA/TatE family subunit [unclassified Streptomyces]MDT0408592.1 twin-arginine translocase TatA/TatE family subunit [Streptomyces sp. DSM 41979]MYQ57173.1 MttA/family protein [Streptomyces sp. SID4926]SCE57541.1 sec-independent protein translocase protein TatA [Streptomyces sp. DfronAA-171]
MFGLSELAILLLVVVVVLGVKRLPGLVRSAGRASRALRSEARATGDAPLTDPADPKLIRARPGDWTRERDEPAA